MTMQIAKFRDSDGGATSIEYAIIAGGIAVAIVLLVGTIGANLNTTFTSASTAVL